MSTFLNSQNQPSLVIPYRTQYVMTMEELLARHRKEQRDLQSRITQKKKQASKKTRKSVNDECETLEKELKRRHEEEIATLNGEEIPVRVDDELTPEQIEALTLQVDEPTLPTSASTPLDPPQSQNPEPDNPSVEAGQSKKPNRTKARLARRAAEQEAIAQQAADEADNLPDLKTQERERMLSYMAERKLEEQEIRADGHCLYSAVADQLVHLDMPIPSSADGGDRREPYRRIRAVAADYIERNSDDYVPFLEEDLESYLHKVRETGEWGGQVELMALAKSLGVDIHVLQDFGRVEKFEGGKKGDMWLGYYKHGFGLGEHYNSLRKKE